MNQTLVFKSLRMLQPYTIYHLKVLPVNLDKFHYTVTERSIDHRITTDDGCSTVGFSHDEFVEKITDDNLIFYAICVNYVGECEGTIYSDEVKTCTVENYIFAENLYPHTEPDDNTAGAA